MSTKYIFVTGGVVSGLGKGISAASPFHRLPPFPSAGSPAPPAESRSPMRAQARWISPPASGSRRCGRYTRRGRWPCRADRARPLLPGCARRAGALFSAYAPGSRDTGAQGSFLSRRFLRFL